MGGGPKPEHLLCTLPFPEPTPILDRIRKNHPHVKITYRNLSGGNAMNSREDELVPKEIWDSVTILVTLSLLPPSPSACPQLGLIHFFSAGTNHIASNPIYTSTTIPLTTSSGIHGPQIAEWVLLTSLVSSHLYDTLHSWQIDHKWGTGDQGQARLRSISDNVGKRLGVLGYGSIGRQVANVCKAMGMDVIAYTASPRTSPESKKDQGFIVPGTGDPDGSIPSAWYSGLDKQSLHQFLAQNIDHLLVSVPLTKDTEHFLAKEEFDILAKRNAFISNISRGQILKQGDLIASLKEYAADDKPPGADSKPLSEAATTSRSKEELEIAPKAQSAPKKKRGLRGAALDVTDPEPLPEDNELWDAPNCIVTPHISSLSIAYGDRAFQVLEANLTRRENGEKMINVVDRKKGY